MQSHDDSTGNSSDGEEEKKQVHKRKWSREHSIKMPAFKENDMSKINMPTLIAKCMHNMVTQKPIIQIHQTKCRYPHK